MAPGRPGGRLGRRLSRGGSAPHRTAVHSVHPLSAAPDTAALTGNSTALLLQGVAQLAVFGLAHLAASAAGSLGLSAGPARLGAAGRAQRLRPRACSGCGGPRPRGAAPARAVRRRALAAGCGWRARLPRGASALTTAVLAPAALAEELTFRGPAAGAAGVGLRARHRDRHHVADLRPGARTQSRGDAARDRQRGAGGRLPRAWRSTRRAASGPRRARTSAGTPTLAALDAPVSGLPFRIPLHQLRSRHGHLAHRRQLRSRGWGRGDGGRSASAAWRWRASPTKGDAA